MPHLEAFFSQEICSVSSLSQSLLLALGLAMSVSTMAQSSRQMTLLVPFPAGGATDQLARGLAQKLNDKKGYNLVVDNKPGAGAQVAVNSLKQAPADGHTLFIGDTGAFVLNRFLYSKLSYDVDKDMQPVSLVAKAPLFLMVPAASPFKTVAELMSAAAGKEMPYGSPGVGTLAHVGAEMMRANTPAQLMHVPYKGSAPALVDLVAGQVAFVLDPLASSGGFLKDGRFRALGVSARERFKLLPDVPTLIESGLKNVSFSVGFGIAVKAGTPAEVVDRLARDIAEVARDKELVDRFASLGMEITTTTPQGFSAYIASEVNAYAPVVKALKITLD
jgi:tripartite-type tricarboxylate transporter receptor subunit TctC